MQTGENLALRWLLRELEEGEPVPLIVYGAMRQLDRMTPDQRERVIKGMDVLEERRKAAGATGMSTQAAIEAGLLTAADVWGAFGIEPLEGGPA
jgi:hypothetical protein